MRNRRAIALAAMTAMLLICTSACGRRRDENSVAETESIVRETETANTTENGGILNDAEDMVSDVVDDGRDIISDVISGTEMTTVTESADTTASETERNR